VNGRQSTRRARRLNGDSSAEGRRLQGSLVTGNARSGDPEHCRNGGSVAEVAARNRRTEISKRRERRKRATPASRTQSRPGNRRSSADVAAETPSTDDTGVTGCQGSGELARRRTHAGRSESILRSVNLPGGEFDNSRPPPRSEFEKRPAI
jgi:hypothetical protein